ncbi:C4-dicarboxylate transporter DcuC [Natranaerobius trueperi]|uniref:C4-dicarboxylate ABC transporter n=1 Tax=Natranaerobius trueperi TaxID=759412 RepID=A0A226BZH2_9FIRM|nr:C4-dicarboxylate transporter DcuC [Natranaerobius trueperi]OWZ84335.1 C4-dicarboxylate ABC transporter [Natranaerobius trueperi]
MEGIFSILLGLVVITLVARGILKGYLPQAVLFAAGIGFMIITAIVDPTSVLPDDSTGFILFDIFEFINATASNRGGGLGLLIMAVAGFAKYMEHIGAARSLAEIGAKPLGLINNPYIVLGLSYIIGQTLNIFIPSASGLGVLLMAIMFPVLLKLGVSAPAATAVIGTTAILDLGPASGNTVLAAETTEMSVAAYFVQHQLWVGIPVIIVVAIAHVIVQNYFDKKEGVSKSMNIDPDNVKEQAAAKEGEEERAPAWYAMLPLIPLALLLIFSEFIIDEVRMDVFTAMVIGCFVAMVCQLIRGKGAMNVADSLKVFMDGMGNSFAKVVTLIIAAETFAHGLMTVGFIDTLIEGAESLGAGFVVMMLVMTAIIGAAALLTGSGNAPFFAFADLSPAIADGLGIATVALILPMQFASGMMRAASPISGVIIGCSGIAGLSPIQVVKRTSIPCILGVVTTVIVNLIVL